MLIHEDGKCVGMLSAGCIEEDIIMRSKEALEAKIPRTIAYDLRHENDLSWGQGTGCNGIMHVLLEPIMIIGSVWDIIGSACRFNGSL
jgi:xanthine dehydrogenase accessory factor